jgi:RNA polymerase sigma factor (sigma-70 family)
MIQAWLNGPERYRDQGNGPLPYLRSLAGYESKTLMNEGKIKNDPDKPGYDESKGAYRERFVSVEGMRDYGLDEMEPALSSTERGYEAVEGALVAESALSFLSDPQRQAVTLVWIEGYPQGEASKIMGTSQATVSRLLTTARDELRRVWPKVVGDDE